MIFRIEEFRRGELNSGPHFSGGDLMSSSRQEAVSQGSSWRASADGLAERAKIKNLDSGFSSIFSFFAHTITCT